MYEDFDEWFEELLDIAYSDNYDYYMNISQSKFMYEDYFEMGDDPEEAYRAEWGG